MGQNVELNRINIIQNGLRDYKGFTLGEKKYCIEHLSEWITNENGLDIMIRKFAEKSLDVRPFLKNIGLLK